MPSASAFCTLAYTFSSGQDKSSVLQLQDCFGVQAIVTIIAVQKPQLLFINFTVHSTAVVGEWLGLQITTWTVDWIKCPLFS